MQKVVRRLSKRRLQEEKTPSPKKSVKTSRKKRKRKPLKCVVNGTTYKVLNWEDSPTLWKFMDPASPWQQFAFKGAPIIQYDPHPTVFRFIHEYLRDGKLSALSKTELVQSVGLATQLAMEAQYFLLKELSESIRHLVSRYANMSALPEGVVKIRPPTAHTSKRSLQLAQAATGSPVEWVTKPCSNCKGACGNPQCNLGSRSHQDSNLALAVQGQLLREHKSKSRRAEKQVKKATECLIKSPKSVSGSRSDSSREITRERATVILTSPELQLGSNNELVSSGIAATIDIFEFNEELL